MTIKYYVYILRDPRDGKPFYVGKGKHRRMGQHVLQSDDNNAKAAKIREIEAAGRGIEYSVDSEWTREADAFWRESWLIQTTEGLTNIVHNNRNKPRKYFLHDLMFDALANLYDSPKRAMWSAVMAFGMFYDRLPEDDKRRDILWHMVNCKALKPLIDLEIENVKNQRFTQQAN